MISTSFSSGFAAPVRPKFGQKLSAEALKQRFTQDQSKLRELASELQNTVPGLMGEYVMGVGVGLVGDWGKPSQNDPVGVLIMTNADKPEGKQKVLNALREKASPVPGADELYQYKGALVKVTELPPPVAY